MLLFKSEVAQSLIPSAGKGLFTKEFLPKAKVVIVPNQQHTLYTADQISKFPADSIEAISSIRWFENIHTVDPEWSEESYLNHSFSPNLIWHLGFMFAVRDIQVGEELTIDYTHLLDENTDLGILDSITGRPIIGMSFEQKMFKSCQELLKIFS